MHEEIHFFKENTNSLTIDLTHLFSASSHQHIITSANQHINQLANHHIS